MDSGLVRRAQSQLRIEPQVKPTDWGMIDALLPDIKRGTRQRDPVIKDEVRGDQHALSMTLRFALFA